MYERLHILDSNISGLFAPLQGPCQHLGPVTGSGRFREDSSAKRAFLEAYEFVWVDTMETSSGGCHRWRTTRMKHVILWRIDRLIFVSARTGQTAEASRTTSWCSGWLRLIRNPDYLCLSWSSSYDHVATTDICFFAPLEGALARLSPHEFRVASKKSAPFRELFSNLQRAKVQICINILMLIATDCPSRSRVDLLNQPRTCTDDREPVFDRNGSSYGVLISGTHDDVCK